MKKFYLGVFVFCSVSVAACGGGDSEQLAVKQDDSQEVIPNAQDAGVAQVENAIISKLSTDINLNSFKKVSLESDVDESSDEDKTDDSDVGGDEAPDTDTKKPASVVKPAPVVKPPVKSNSIEIEYLRYSYNPGLVYEYKFKCPKSGVFVLSKRGLNEPLHSKYAYSDFQCTAPHLQGSLLPNTPREAAFIFDAWERKSNGELVHLRSLIVR